MAELKSDITAGSRWFESVNVSALSDDIKRSILEAVKNKLDFSCACEALGIAKSSLHRYLTGEGKVLGDVVKCVLQYLSKQEFEEIVSDWDRLKALGVIREDGVVDYDLVLKIFTVASRNEYLKNAALQFVVREFR